MNFADLFDNLIKQRQITLKLPRDRADILRVSLTKKFKTYRIEMRKLDWLAPDLETASLSMEYSTETEVAKYFLRPRKSTSFEYTLILPDSSNE